MTHRCYSACPHIVTVGDYTKEDIIERQQSPCDSCDNTGPNLWICLHRDCLYIGCSDNDNHHSIKHYQKNNHHSLFLNLTTLRVYCLLCECEVFLENNDPPIPGMLPSHPLMNKSDTDSEDESEGHGEGLKPKGLTGLQNLGNTCYMNSAIQALSNCPQLSNFFLECGAFVHFDKKPGLSKSFLRLMKEMWHRKRPSYVVPSGIAYGIKMVFPVFRGYTQQDAQEFLRCFMDQLHEELKEPVVEMIGMSSTPESQEELDSARGDSAIPISDDSSQSDGDYETCDSGLSSEMSSCADEITNSQEQTPNPVIELADLSVSCSAQHSTKSTKSKKSNSQGDINVDLGSGDSPLVETGFAANEDKNKNYNTELSMVPNSTQISCENSGAGDAGVHNSEVIHCHNDSDSTSDAKPEIPLSWNENQQAAHPANPSTSVPSIVKGTGSSVPVIQHKHAPTHSLFSSMFAARKRKPIQYRSIISDIFDGKILSSVQCLTCDTVSTTKETFQDLSLPIPNKDHLHMIHASQGSQQKTGVCTDVYSHQGWFSSFFSWMLSWFWGPSVTLLDCLSAFFSADELKGDNMYSCEKCKKLRNGIKYSKVIELPEVLCIHLKRFRHEVMYSSKIGSYVSFPLEGLDMSPFLHKSYPRGVTTYDLASVICHHGTAGSGHYTTYSLNYLNEQWYEFDDQYVTAVDAEMVRHCEAYVLFYRKTSDEMVKKRQCAVELMERSRNEQGLLKFHISKQWINKFNNFAEPGPITNTDFLCIHGGVPPQKASYVEESCTVMPQAVWEYLHDTFGGGPPCTHLFICHVCQSELDCITQKRKQELEDFISMNTNFQHMEAPTVVFAISMTWFKTWENFVCKEGDPPGPIDNSSICYVKNNQVVLKLGSDYCPVSKEMYQYFQGIYGGGPDVALQPNSNAISFYSGRLSTSSIGHAKTPPPTSVTNYVQNAQVHSSSRANLSSHSQPSLSCSGKFHCDQDLHKSIAAVDAEQSSSAEDKGKDILVENI